MFIDCDSCDARGPACGDCVVTVLLGSPPAEVQLEPEERAALAVLTAAGFVPQLRLVLAADAGWSSDDADTPIPYGVAYQHRYALPYDLSAVHRRSGRHMSGGAADTG